MTGEIGLVLTILGASVVLFASERVRVDVVSMMVLLALLLTGLLTTEEAFSGFSNPAVITVWAIYIVSASLTHTGIADVLGRYIGRIAGTEEARLIFVIMLAVGVMSAFMNNIGAAAVLLPVTIGLGRKARIPASKLLIPLAFGSLLGGITTLIGTPPNLLASDALQEVGLEPFNLFDFTPMGIIILSSSLVYMTFIGRHLLPHYEETLHEDPQELNREYQLKDYLAELHVMPESPLIGKTIVESRLGEAYDLTVMGVVRDGRMRLGILPNAHIRPGDVLLVKGSEEQMLSVRRKIGVTLSAESEFDEHDWQNEEVSVAELVVSQKAPFIGKTLKSANFRARYGLTVLAIWREEKSIAGKLDNVRLRLGDTLLVQGRRERIEEAGNDISFLLLTSRQEEPSLRTSKAPLNLVIFISMITLVGLGWLHISVAAVLGAILSVLTGCLTMDEAYKSIEWKSVYLIAGMLPMGIAMENTGTALFLSEQIIGLVGGLGPRGIMVGLFLLTTVLTAFMSNAAAAVLVAPIAIQSSVTLGIDPHAFVMGTAIAASNSFVTPIGHQACVLVYGPGGYRFFDFARVGLPLTIVIWILMTIFLPIFFPFYPA
ncbi:MAG: SLC13 family permease [Anaerolineales bacterium]|nr:SLC13 family permease [Anaerolineales bacterium]MCB8937212.1 SLC13 family permease [Ardenticatenaceae bacterium]